MKPSFRKAVPEDYDKILRLKKQVHAHHVQNRPDFFRNSDAPIDKKDLENDARDESVIFVTGQDEEIWGYASVKIISFKDHPIINDHRRYFIDDICIDTKHRGKGLGRFLMNRLESDCRERGIPFLDLNVWKFNHDAIRFYSNCGFEEIMVRMEKRMF